MIRKNFVGLYLGRPIMAHKNLVGLYLGRPIMAHKNIVGLYLGQPIMGREILWAFSWAGPLWSAKSRGPLARLAHYGPQNLMDL